MQNFGGALVIAAGAFFLVVGLKGTQHAALPSLFPPSSTPATQGAQQSQSGTQSSPNPPFVIA